MEVIGIKNTFDNKEEDTSTGDAIFDMQVEKYDFTITCKKLKNAGFSEKEIEFFEKLYSYIGYLYYNEYRRNEIHDQTGKKAYYAYHFQMVTRIMCDIYSSIKRKELSKLNQNELEFINYFERYKIVLLILALFHDSIEDKKFTGENNRQIGFNISIKYNENIEVIYDEIARHLDNLVSEDIFNENEICTYFPLLADVKKNKFILTKDNENLIKFELGILNFVFFLLNNVNNIELKGLDRIHITNDMIRRIVEGLGALTFKINTGHDLYISELISHNSLFIIKVPDFLHNSFVGMSRKQRKKYCKDYSDLYNIVYLLRDNIPDYVINKLDKTMYSLLIEGQYQLDLN